MTINASSYFRPCDCEGGLIETDTTIYLAPSASTDSPTGVIGSDVTGDGTELRPFYSIKRAIEYLENFSIKPGIYATIKGLPGKYYYTNNHSIEIKHKDAKYIKIKFDMLDTVNYHETDIDFTSPVSVVNNSDHDLITFTVNDIGTGFYQIQPGDYIKIIPDNDTLGNIYSAVWQGFYKVTNTSGNDITIKYKRHQSDGSYNSHLYGIPDGSNMSGITVNVIKLSTHIYISYPFATTDFFISSRYGFGGLQVNASDELYDTSSDRGCSFSYIYDGELNDIILHLNGFGDCCHYTNLNLTFDLSDERLYSCATSCDRFLGCLQCSISIYGISANCCRYPFEFVNSDIWLKGYKKICFTNNYDTGFNLSSSKFVMTEFTNDSDIINTFYNYIGLSFINSSSFSCNSVNSRYNTYGILSSNNSIIKFFFYPDANTLKTNIKNNSNFGIYCDSGSEIDISYTDISENFGGGIKVSNNSSIITSVTTESSTINTYCNYNGSYGIDCGQNSVIRVYRLQSNNNSLDGIYCNESSSASLIESECSNNSGKGLYIHTNSVLYCSNIKCEYNGDWGIRVLFNTKAYIINYTSTYRINNNDTYNLVVDYNSMIDIRTHDSITDTVPAKNTTPIYTNASGGSYILESII